MTVRTHTLEGFIRTLEIIKEHAQAGKLVACSINLDPTGLGHYAYKLLDGTAMPGMTELEPEADTAPGKGQKKVK